MLPYRPAKEVLPSEDLEEFCKYVAEYNPHLVSALEKYVSDHGAKGVMKIKLKDLNLDMIAYEDIWAKNDCLLAAKGQAITKPVIDRLYNFANRVGVLEPFHVLDLTPVR